ncbi:MAG TPA: SgcJ/EcaC family oxidoreductase [Bryobacteraceae bacterium]|nr:SgcJ/EcaC family oxidoreductase [Bryobacteraceae bacterium]
MPARTPEEMHAAFAEAFNSGDLEALVALYEPDAVFVGAPDQIAKGTAAIRAALREMLASSPALDIETTGIYSSDDGIALTHGRWTISGLEPDGGTVKMTGKSSEVLRRQPDGSWLVVIDNPGSE